ncbi:MAG: cell division protein FtsQ/DivIB, partial [Bacteroidota bacterium]
PIKRIDVPSIEDMLRVDTRVMEAQVYVDAHQKLIIDVEQRRPIARVINSRNDQFYMDRNGRYIQISDHRAVRVPVVTGYVESLKAGESLASKPRLKEALSILHLIRKDEFLTALIEQIHVESTHRIILIPKVGDERIILDHLDHLDHKLKNLKRFYKELARSNSWKKYKEIDISYRQQVAAREFVTP